MDYYLLTDLAATMGYHLAMSGAETFRVEDTVHRILGAYGIECEVFAIPNSISVSLEAANGKPLMVLRRIGFHGNDLEKLEKLNALSRRICAEKPAPDEAFRWLRETLDDCRTYRTGVYYLGNILAGMGFCIVFGGALRDCLWAGLIGLIIGLVSRFMDSREANPFFSTMLASCLMALPAYAAAGLGLLERPNAAIIGALMILVPGLLITNSMRDIIYGDTNSGMFRIVQVVLMAMAIALGTAAAWRLTAGIYGQTVSSTVSWPALAQAAAVFIGVVGRSVAGLDYLSNNDAENIFIDAATSYLPPILAGFACAGVLAAAISSSDSYLLISASAVSQNLYRGVFKKDATEKQVMWCSRITLVIITIVAMAIAWNSNSTIFGITSFAWAGFGAAFGPLMLLSLFWKRTTYQGAIAGMVAGGAMVFFWKLVLKPLGGMFGIYELLPAFIFSVLMIVVVSLCTAEPDAQITEEFDKVKSGKGLQ